MTTNIKDYSTTQASNTSLNSISVAEGMLPSNLNNAIRALMKNTRDWFNDAQWIEYGDGDASYTATYASGTSFTIAGVNVTSIYHAGRRIKLTASTPGTIFGTISSSSFSTNTTVNVTWDSGSLSNEAISNVYIGALSKTNDSIPTGISATKIADGTISDTEFQYLNGVTSAIQTQLDGKQATITGSASTIDTESLTANRAVISNGSQKIAVSDVTDTELGYLDGVTSSVQTQIDSKQATVTGAATTITSSNLTASRALQSNGSGKVEVSDVTSTELSYLDGVTSAIQTQIDNISAGTVSTINDTNFTIQNNSDTSKKAKFDASSISASTTRTYTFPDASGTLTVGGISNVVEDTTPQLGGNLDMNGNDIVTTSNADLELAPDGTGHVTVKGNDNQGTIQFNCENNSHGQQIKAAPHSESASNVLTIPSTGGDSTLVSDASTSTLTNKTLTSPVISEIVSVSNGNIAVTPNGTGEVRLSGSMNSTFSSTGKSMVLGF
tara:strand:+ start:954 stop:2444 length:1491 start_codon:yes stop_codon:yes gene_type:complete